jgi:hypothetical protein
MAKLRRLPGEYYGHRPYRISGSLDGIVPGRRSVGRLIVGRFGPQASEGLAPLRAFSDLRELELEWALDVDLEPLTALALEQLRIADGRGIDLEPIARIATLEQLSVIAPADCSVPSCWPLSPRLRQIMLIARNGDARFISDAVSAIPWSQLRSLEGLALMGEACRVDLGFLEALPWLRYLDVRGILHAGRDGSPIVPPFAGLPGGLLGGLIEVPDDEAAGRAWLAHAGPPEGHDQRGLGFRALHWPTEEARNARPWAIREPDLDGDPWTTYGSLHHAGQGQDGDTETDALRAARSRLRAADPALLRRLDFDPEANGTGIYAHSRADLEAAIELLGLDESSR